MHDSLDDIRSTLFLISIMELQRLIPMLKIFYSCKEVNFKRKFGSSPRKNSVSCTTLESDVTTTYYPISGGLSWEVKNKTKF